LLRAKTTRPGRPTRPATQQHVDGLIARGPPVHAPPPGEVTRYSSSREGQARPPGAGGPPPRPPGTMGLSQKGQRAAWPRPARFRCAARAPARPPRGSPSPRRTPPPCPHSQGPCGISSWLCRVALVMVARRRTPAPARVRSDRPGPAYVDLDGQQAGVLLFGRVLVGDSPAGALAVNASSAARRGSRPSPRPRPSGKAGSWGASARRE